jgi:DNA-binding GntR family transcriptional regulator
MPNLILSSLSLHDVSMTRSVPSRAEPTAGQKPRPAKAARRGPVPGEDEIYRLITEAIVTKQLRPGSRLKEAALAEQFGVSRSRVRGVFQRLVDLDFIEFRLNHGAMVRRPSPDEARAIFATRRLIEGEAVRTAAARASAQDFRRLRTFVKKENLAFEARSKGVAALSSGFHILLGEMCGNPVLARILNQLVHRSVLIQSLYERETQNTICLVHEHAEIIELMETGKIEAAVSAMQHHLDHIEASLDYDPAGRIDRRLALSIG